METALQILSKYIDYRLPSDKRLTQTKILKAMEEYAQMKVNELNKSDVIKSVCDCGKGNAWTWDAVRGKNICSYCGKDEQTVL